MLQILVTIGLMFSFIFSPPKALADASAVVLQYHHVSDTTPQSTSVTPEQFIKHLDWLENNQFTVLSLETIVSTVAQKKHFNHNKIAAITFDDAAKSVCTIAWPILKQRNLPFTVFINTEPIERQFKTQCTWEELSVMTRSGLMTPANHSHRHLNMVSKHILADISRWKEIVRDEINIAQSLIQQRLAQSSMLFAYPYGEYNFALSRELNALGFISFAQNSGAIGPYSNLQALPRFPASGQFAQIETLAIKLNSLAFPGVLSPQSDNPISEFSQDNPPTLIIKLAQPLVHSLNCFDGQGQPITIVHNNGYIEVSSPKPLDKGRHRYNCTSQSNEQDRFYWASHQWLIE